MNRPKAREIIIGERVGMLVVVAPGERRNGPRFLCRCDCGTEKTVDASAIRMGAAKSCGCLNGVRPSTRAIQPIVREDHAILPLGDGRFAVIDLVDLELAQFKWNAKEHHATWYAERSDGDNKIALHREVAGRAGMEIVGREVDHEDGDGLNCRRSNLRPATRQENGKNRRLRRDSSSGYRGVTEEDSGRWSATIVCDGRDFRLGTFDAKGEAALAYAQAARLLFGRFAPRELSVTGRSDGQLRGEIQEAIAFLQALIE